MCVRCSLKCSRIYEDDRRSIEPRPNVELHRSSFATPITLQRRHPSRLLLDEMSRTRLSPSRSGMLGAVRGVWQSRNQQRAGGRQRAGGVQKRVREAVDVPAMTAQSWLELLTYKGT